MYPNKYFTEEHEITIRSLFWKLLLHWKWIVLAACLFAVLGYGYARYKQYNQQKVEEENISETMEEELKEDWFDYETAEEYTRETIRRYEKALNNEYQYADNSLLMKMDPYHVVSTTQDFEIHVEGDVDINELTMLGRQLTNSVNSIETVGKIAEKYGCDPQYIREIINTGVRENQYELGGIKINSDTESSGLGLVEGKSDGEKYYFYVNAKANDKQLTIDLVEIMSECVQRRSAEITRLDFTLTPLPVFTYEVVDGGIISSQNDSRVRAYDYSDKLMKLKTIIENMDKARASKEELIEEISDNAVSRKKYVVFGFVGGAILMIIILLLKSFMSAIIQTEEDFRSWFILSSLGTAPVSDGSQKVTGLKKKIMEKLEGSSVRQSQEAFYRMTSVNVVNAAQENKAVLLTGSVEKEEMQKLSDQLIPLLKGKGEQVKFTFAENFIGNPESRECLQEADSVVLVEKRNYSKVEDVREEIEVIASLNKKILGVILL